MIVREGDTGKVSCAAKPALDFSYSVSSVQNTLWNHEAQRPPIWLLNGISHANGQVARPSGTLPRGRQESPPAAEAGDVCPVRVRTAPERARQNLARRGSRLEADDASGDHARRPAMTKPSLRPSCLGARWQARPLAQERSAKALDVWQQHGERGHGGRAPGPSRRSPQASWSSSARSCRSSAAAGRHGPRAVLCARERSQEAQQAARAPSRASQRPGLGWGGVRCYNFMPR